MRVPSTRLLSVLLSQFGHCGFNLLPLLSLVFALLGAYLIISHTHTQCQGIVDIIARKLSVPGGVVIPLMSSQRSSSRLEAIGVGLTWPIGILKDPWTLCVPRVVAPYHVTRDTRSLREGSALVVLQPWLAVVLDRFFVQVYH